MGKVSGRKATADREVGAPARTRCLADLTTNADLHIRADTRLSTAWTMFLDRDLYSLTVVDDAGKPVGTLVRRDLADAVLDDAPTVPGSLLEELMPSSERLQVAARTWWPREWRSDEALVEDIMRTTVNTLPASATLADAAAVFEVAELSEVVVVNEEGLMLGLVAADDLVPYLPDDRRANRARPGASGRAPARR
jgi:CBS domain-containing protein